MNAEKMIIDERACSGCNLCVQACSLRYNGTCSYNAFIKITREEKSSAFFIKHCAVCETFDCVESCEAGALEMDKELGIVRVNIDLCVGCGTCEDACQYNFPKEKDESIMMCDYCGGEPECVSICPTGALQFNQAEVGP